MDKSVRSSTSKSNVGRNVVNNKLRSSVQKSGGSGLGALGKKKSKHPMGKKDRAKKEAREA
jgi:hypothetical protein